MKIQNGFTLLELILVIGIISTLSALSVPTFHNFKYKASQSEVKTTLKSIETILQPYIMSGGKFEENQCDEKANIQGELDICYLSGSTFDSNNPNWCNINNFLNYKTNGCNHMYYQYSISVQENQTQLQGANYIIGAKSLAGRICPDAGVDTWALASCGKTLHIKRIKDILTCEFEINPAVNPINYGTILNCSWNGGDNF